MVGEASAVDASGDAAEHGDAEGSAQFTARLGDGGGGAGAFGRGGGEDQAGAQGHERREPGEQQDGSGDDEPRFPVGLQEHQRSRESQYGAGAHQQGGVHPRGEPRDPQGDDGAGHRGRQLPQPGRERRVSDDHLEVLGGEEAGAVEHGADQDHAAHRDGERRYPEQRHVEERFGETALAPYEADPQEHADRQGAEGRRRDAFEGQLLDPVHQGERHEERQRHTWQIDSAPDRRRPVRGEQERRGHDQQRHGRQRDQEDRAPPEEVQEGSADQRAEGTAGHEAEHPHGDRKPALLRVGEQVADHRQGRGASPAAPTPWQARAAISSPVSPRTRPRPSRPRRPPLRRSARGGGRTGRRASPW